MEKKLGSILDDIGVSPGASRHGPTLALTGLIAWAFTIAAYLLIKPPDPMPGSSLAKPETTRLIIAIVLGAFGTFAGSILSAIGMLLSLAERKHRPGLRATLGVAGGIAGIAALLLVILEILLRVRTR